MPIDYPKLFQIVDKITTLPVIKKGDRWYGKCYIDGKPAQRWDKIVIELKPKNIRVLEQGGDIMSLACWMVRYGGCRNYPEAYQRLRNEDKAYICQQNWTYEDKPVRFVTEDTFNIYQTGLWHDTLYLWLCEIFKKEDVDNTYTKYKISSNYNHSTCFWYINQEGAICHDKNIKYLDNGHRDKERGAWRRFKTQQGYSSRCYFGEHLEALKQHKKVYLLESEKSSLIMSIKFPQHLFLATGGKNNLRDVRKDWKLLPDYDAYEYWSSRYPIQCVKWWESFLDYEVGKTDDIVDYYLKKIEK